MFMLRFFYPAIRELRTENKLYLLCLSNGNAEGLGKEREKELERSCRHLKFAEPPTIIEDPELQDGMEIEWPKGLVANHVQQFMQQKAAEGEDEKIDIVMTFDEWGVSYHKNHIACFNGVAELMCSHIIDFELYTLQTVEIWRKFISYMDISNCDYWHYHCFNVNPFNTL